MNKALLGFLLIIFFAVAPAFGAPSWTEEAIQRALPYVDTDALLTTEGLTENEIGSIQRMTWLVLLAEDVTISDGDTTEEVRQRQAKAQELARAIGARLAAQVASFTAPPTGQQRRTAEALLVMLHATITKTLPSTTDPLLRHLPKIMNFFNGTTLAAGGFVIAANGWALVEDLQQGHYALAALHGLVVGAWSFVVKGNIQYFRKLSGRKPLLASHAEQIYAAFEQGFISVRGEHELEVSVNPSLAQR